MMLELNRTAIVVRPKQIFLDWLNNHPILDLHDPVSLEDLQDECTVLLVPATGSLEDALAWLQPRKVELQPERARS